MKEDIIKEIVFDSVEEINHMLHHKLNLSMDEILLGPDDKIDSVNLIRLIIIIEQEINTRLNINITLANSKAFSEKESPFRTIGSLINYISFLITQES